MQTDDLYIAIYEDVSPKAEYFQADSIHRNMLTEAMVIAGIGWALTEFSKAFFGGLAKSAAGAVVDKIKVLFGASADNGDRDILLEALDLLRPHLGDLAGATEVERAELQNAISTALQTRGFPEDTADETAKKLFETLTKAAADEAA